VKPSELARLLRANGLTLTDMKGISYSPASGEWSLGADVGVNYLVFARKA
jgi:2-polyprenyl-6-hydroxyphenyl methylase/3-demethylubiquinone-9 3-methyltransferase